jgi:hypothetical protein
MSDTADLITSAKEILKRNDRGLFTIPAEGLYPHQWLWDSCFIAIGLRHHDVERAKIEILSLLRGQWSNGMVPHVIFTPGKKQYRHVGVWRSWVSPFAPDNLSTSGITQPPMIAEAVVRIGEKMPLVERRSWYRQVFPNLLAYHQWLYRERDPHGEGLALQIHPWETGFDNTPPWMQHMHEHLLPWWIRALRATKTHVLVSWLRRDTRYVPANQRPDNVDAMALYAAQRRLLRKQYDINNILDHALFAIEDLAFNCILVRANQLLLNMAKTIRADVPEDLVKRMRKAARHLEELWDPYTETYYSREFVTHQLLKEPSVASLLPLYAGTITPQRAALLVKALENEHIFGPPYPVPSTPLNSTWFNAERYWQGPTWFNTNWLIIDGLRRYGYKDHADALAESMRELVAEHGFYEYYNPLSGEALGAANFSWTAALSIDLLETGKRKK